MAKYYPMMLNIENKKCVVVGGGTIAYRKCLELLQYGGLVTVVADNIKGKFLELIEAKTIRYIKAYYEERYIEDAFIVIASTDNNNVNAQIFKDCSKRNILVNVVDDPINCNFIVPAKIRRGDLTISVSTNGKSPVLSKQIKEELEKHYDESYGVLIDILGELRQEVIKKVNSPAARKLIFEKMLTAEYLQKTRSLTKEQIKAELRELINEYYY